MARLKNAVEELLDWVRAEHGVYMQGMTEHHYYDQLAELMRRVSFKPGDADLVNGTRFWDSLKTKAQFIHAAKHMHGDGLDRLRIWIAGKGWEPKAAAPTPSSTPEVEPDTDLMNELEDVLGETPQVPTPEVKPKRRSPKPEKVYDDWGSW